MVALWSQRLAELVVRLIEMPEVRLGGAEEGIRCLVAMIQQMLEHQEPFLKELGDRAEAAFQRIQQAIVRLSKPGSPRGQAPLTSADVQELLRSYAKWCYQNLILHQVIQGLLSLRGLLSDELREVNACRTRLGELLRIFEDPVSEPGGQVADRFNSLQGEAPGRRLFPHGSATLDEALAGMSRQVTPAQLTALDSRVQKMIRQQFIALVHVCLTPAKVLANLEAAMQKEAEALVRQTVSWADAAELFLEQYPSEPEALDALTTAFEESRGELSGASSSVETEVCILTVPAGEAGERIRQLVEKIVLDVKLITVTGGDDIVMYRETTYIPLVQLPQLGTAAQEAYRYLSAFENFTPHTRSDITFQVPTLPPSAVVS